jgi:hypothetical protein
VSGALVAVLGVLVCSVFVAGGWFLLGDDGGDADDSKRNDVAGTSGPADPTPGDGATTVPEPDPTPSATTTEPGFPTGSPGEPTAGTGPPLPPAGYETVTDPAGFALAVPLGWERTEEGASIFYTAPDGSRRLQVFELEESTPYESAVLARDTASGAEGYEEIAFEPVGTGPLDAVELEYFRADEEQGWTHLLDHRFAAADGVTLYALVIYGPAEDTGPQHVIQDTALASFCQLAYCPVN